MKFNQAYIQNDFLQFLDTFLPEDFVAREEDIILNEKRCKEIKEAKILGTCESLNLYVLELEHNRENDPRITIASDAFKILADHWIHQALVIFKSKNSNNYRLSFLSISLELGEKNKVTKKYSNAKRYSYYLGPNASVNTPNQFLMNRGRVSNLENLISRFSVDVVTKEFFNTYRDTFFDITDEFDKNETFKREVVLKHGITTSDFVKKLMGQIVFLYFLQRKGWLGVQPGEKWGTGNPHFMRTIFDSCIQQGKNYYNDYLETLFYDCLGKADRGNNAVTDDQSFSPQFNVRIPYLNGGLFEDVYEWRDTNIEIDNRIFDTLLSFLDRYNFTIDENTPSDQEVSVDPEMLGKIFENLLEVKDRKSKGTYYTPREIVHYMCRESLINYLLTGSGVSEERLRRLFTAKDAELFIIADEDTMAKNQKLVELNEIAEKVDLLLKNIKIVDPAVGSGAFPMGMLSEISSTRYYLNNNFLHKINRHGKPLSLYDIKRETLENCIYGVDIDPGAVEIAKLRFWLALVVDHDIDEIEALPNLDYKIMQGNSLLEEYKSIKLFNESLLSATFEDNNGKIQNIEKELSVINSKLLKLYQTKPEWMRNKTIERPYELSALENEQKRLKDNLKYENDKSKVNVENTLKPSLFNEENKSENIRKILNSLHKQFFKTNDKEKKNVIKKKIEEVEWDLIAATLGENGKEFELADLEKFKKSNAKPFFLWQLNFPEVFEKGGFDIVVANPPYVDSETMTKNDSNDRKTYKDIYETARGNWDLFVIFVEKGFNLLKMGGVISFIVPNKLIGASYTNALKNYLLTKNIRELRDYSKVDVFKEVSVYPVVFVAVNNSEHSNVAMITMESETEIKYKQSIDPEIFYRDIYWDKFFLSPEKLNIILKLHDLQQLSSLIKNISDAATVSEAYKIAGYLHEQLPNSNFYKKFINTGTIDPYISMWGHKKTQYIKQSYDKPLMMDTDLKALSASRFEQACSNKIIIAGMSKRLECVYDEGECLAGKSTTIILENNSNLISLKYLLAIMNSQLISFWFTNYFNSLKMAGGYLNVSARELELLPIKIPTKEQEYQLTEVVNQILLNKSNTENTDTKNLELQIDQLVYKLYNLTPEEIAVIENKQIK